MREILFRGKKENFGWVYGSLVQAPGFVGIIERDEERYDYPYMDSTTGCIDGNACIVDPDTVGQYTGLTDKNGTRIFEGDVLRYYSDYMREFMGDPCIARYGEFNCSCCDGVYGWFFEGGDIREHDSHVVIGNIHDNPELMEVDHE